METKNVVVDYAELIDDMLKDEMLSYLGSGGSRPTAALTFEELVVHLEKLMDSLSKHPGSDSDTIMIKLGPGPLDEVSLMLRWCRAYRNASTSIYTSIWYESIDVVKIGWAPQWMIVDVEERAQRPRNLADQLWRALKTVCEHKGRVLFLECVDMSAKRLHKHLTTVHGFTQLPHYDFIWIPKSAHQVT